MNSEIPTHADRMGAILEKSYAEAVDEFGAMIYGAITPRNPQKDTWSKDTRRQILLYMLEKYASAVAGQKIEAPESNHVSFGVSVKEITAYFGGDDEYTTKYSPILSKIHGKMQVLMGRKAVYDGSHRRETYFFIRRDNVLAFDKKFSENPDFKKTYGSSLIKLLRHEVEICV